MLTGIDVSHHQGSIDWPTVKASGHTFAFAKATEGLTFLDNQFYNNWNGIADAGLVRGAYHFLRTETDPEAQARYFLSVVGDVKGSLVALDVETSSIGTNPTPSQIQAFTAEFRRRTNNHPLIIYTGSGFWRGVLGNPQGANLGPLWHARYNITPGALYGGWQNFTFWQHSSLASVPGVYGHCDANIFYDALPDLYALTNFHITEDDMSAEEVEKGLSNYFDKITLFGYNGYIDMARQHAAIQRAIPAQLAAIQGDVKTLSTTLIPAIQASIAANLDAELDDSVKAAILTGTEEGVRKVLGSLDE